MKRTPHHYSSIGDDLTLAATRALELEHSGDEEIELYITESTRLNASALGQSVDSVTTATLHGAGVRVVQDGRQGFVSGDLGQDRTTELVHMIHEAREQSRAVDRSVVSEIAQLDPLLASHDSSAYFADGSVNLTAAKQQVLELEAATRSMSGVVATKAAKFVGGRTRSCIVTTTGTRSEATSSVSHLAVTAIVENGDRTPRVGYHVQSGRSQATIDPRSIASRAVGYAKSLCGTPATKHSSELPVVLSAKVVADLLDGVGGALSAESYALDRSFLAGRINSMVAAPGLSLVDDPSDPNGVGGSMFDGEGAASRPTTCIAAGRLISLLTTGASARTLGMARTASAYRGYNTLPRATARSLRFEWAPGSETRRPTS